MSYIIYSGFNQEITLKKVEYFLKKEIFFLVPNIHIIYLDTCAINNYIKTLFIMPSGSFHQKSVQVNITTSIINYEEMISNIYERIFNDNKNLVSELKVLKGTLKEDDYQNIELALSRFNYGWFFI